MFNNYQFFELAQLVQGKVFVLLFPLVLTLIIEILLTCVFYFFIKNKSVFLTVILINLITNPALNFFLIIWRGAINLYLVEGLVVLVEFLLLAFSLPRQNKLLLFLLSLVINYCSFWVGHQFLRY